MILTKPEILKRIENGEIEIKPFDKELIGPGSIDMRLGNEFRFFTKVRRKIKAEEDVDHKKYTRKVKIEDDESILIMPGELVFGITKERLKLPGDVCGWIEGRSRFGRIGLTVHMTAGYIQPGSNNKQVLEMGNMSPAPIELSPGTPICQVILEEAKGEAKFEGRFQGQKHV